MMNYPPNYALLAEEEMEYTTGGSTLWAVLLVSGLAGGILSGMLSNRYMSQLQRELQEKHPDQYAPETEETAKKLKNDTELLYNDSAAGLAINLLAGAAGACIGFGFVDVLMSAVDSAVDRVYLL